MTTPIITAPNKAANSGTLMLKAGAVRENGSSDSATGERLAMASSTTTSDTGTRMSALMKPRTRPSASGFRPHFHHRRRIEPLAHFLAGLEHRHGLLSDRYGLAGARIAPGACFTLLHREGAEAAQLHAVALGERACDLIENRVDDILDVALV